MEKLISLTILVMLAMSMTAQEKSAVSEEPNVVKVNTLSLLLGTGSLFYERKLSDNLSGQMGVGCLSYRIEDSKFSGLILLPPRYAFIPKAMPLMGSTLLPTSGIRISNLKILKPTIKEPIETMEAV